jgi:hypothetical protein
MVARMTSTVGFTPGRPPEWDIERFMRGDEVDTALITLERHRRTFACNRSRLQPGFSGRVNPVVTDGAIARRAPPARGPRPAQEA